jgi:hypothetical protein
VRPADKTIEARGLARTHVRRVAFRMGIIEAVVFLLLAGGLLVLLTWMSRQ